ncbi:MAG TPA: ATP-binding cassette domain-containing protein [Paracoccaceae bacterium]
MTVAVALSDIMHSHPGAARGALAGIDLTVQAGETVALIGPSGVGKTTLLALLDGRLYGWRGAATVLDHALNPAVPPARTLRPDIGFIFQDFALIERATVRQNVLNGRLGRTRPLASLFGRFSDTDHAAADTAMADAGILDLADRRADTLSGGQRQRVAIARCLAQEPRLILADEPISNLDPVRAESILALIAATAGKRGATVIFTSHQPDLAGRFAGRIVALKAGQVAYDGPPGGLDAPRVADLYRDDAKALLRLVG